MHINYDIHGESPSHHQLNGIWGTRTRIKEKKAKKEGFVSSSPYIQTHSLLKIRGKEKKRENKELFFLVRLVVS